METTDALFIANIVSLALLFVTLNAIAKSLASELRSKYFKFVKRKKLNKLLEDKWEIVSSDAHGYPKIMKKENELILV